MDITLQWYFFRRQLLHEQEFAKDRAKGLMVSAKQLGRWRPARRQQIRWNRGVLSLQVAQL
jgi:hypothetical protein